MAYIAPTSWTSGGMDWDNPDASSPIYFDAILRAYAERATMAALEKNAVFSIYDGVIDGCIYRSSWANSIANRIVSLAGSFVTINTDVVTKIDNPYLTLDISEDDELKNLSVSDGELLESAKSKAFLKAAKHFLDLMQIIPQGYSWPTLITSELLYANKFTFSPSYDPVSAGSWGQFLDDCIANKETESDELYTSVSVYMKGPSNYGISTQVGLKYQQTKPLNHKFLMQVYAPTTGVSGVDSSFVRPWDWLDLGLEHGDIFETLIETAETAIGGSLPIAPASPENYAPIIVPPYTYPDYGNTEYRMTFRKFAFDYAVDGGFSFRTDTE